MTGKGTQTRISQRERESHVGGYHTIQQSSPAYEDVSFQIFHITKVKQGKSYHPYPTKPAQQKQANPVDAKDNSI